MVIELTLSLKRLHVVTSVGYEKNMFLTNCQNSLNCVYTHYIKTKGNGDYTLGNTPSILSLLSKAIQILVEYGVFIRYTGPMLNSSSDPHLCVSL